MSTITKAQQTACKDELIACLGQTEGGEFESSWDFDVVNDLEYGRWFASLGAEGIAEISYRNVGSRVVLINTWVDPAYRNNRVVAELISRVLDEIRTAGQTITIICPVFGEFITRNHQYAALIDSYHPGSGVQPQNLEHRSA